MYCLTVDIPKALYKSAVKTAKRKNLTLEEFIHEAIIYMMHKEGVLTEDEMQKSRDIMKKFKENPQDFNIIYRTEITQKDDEHYIPIPKEIINELKLNHNSEFDMILEEGKLILKQVE